MRRNFGYMNKITGTVGHIDELRPGESRTIDLEKEIPFYCKVPVVG
jgi:hypothetical protein